MLDLGIDLRFENYFCGNRYHFQTDLGWEHHVLFDLNHRYVLPTALANPLSISASTTVGGPIAYVETGHNVSLGGLVVRVRFDF